MLATGNNTTPEAPKRGVSINLVTPSPTSDEDTRTSTSNRVANSYSATSALITLNLVSNAASHSSFSLKRRSYHAPANISIYPTLERRSNASHFTLPSLSTPKKTSASKVKCASTPSFPHILTTLPMQSCLEPYPPKKNSTAKE